LINANAAESLMTMGRLEDAIARYRQSLSHYPGYRLALWGLGVALDRDEQFTEAMSIIGKAMASDPTMQELRKPDVFFIPPGDAHYYFAMGYESRGDYRQARREWRAFLEKLPKSPWAFRARWHLGQPHNGQARSRRKKRLAPAPQKQPSKELQSLAYRERIHRRLSYSHYRIRDCYRRTVRKEPKAQGKLRLLFSIDEKGRPINIRTESKSLRSPRFKGCLVDLLRRKSFTRPPRGLVVKIDYPMTFKLR
jgi:tetratricopeptide (TPR) repeat protein